MHYLPYKLSWSIATAGPLETLRGLFRLRDNTLVTKEGIRLRYGRNQRPTLLVVAGQYVDPEYYFLAGVVRPDWMIVDVGAGIGQFALYMAKLCEHVIAYEPDPQNVGFLIENIYINDAGLRVVWRPFALGNGAPIRLSIAGLNTTSSASGGMEVVASTLDAQFPTGEIDVLKVNTAGSEHDVLLGATELFRSRRVRYLVVLDGLDVRLRFPEIASYGYHFFTPGQDGRLYDWPAKPPFSRHVLARRVE